MKQLFATGNGQVALKEVSPPTLPASGAITQTKFSLVSAGSETALILQRRKKPDARATDLALGSSNAGVILETSTGLDPFRPGDSVACVGDGWASHAEQCHVPGNLLTHCPSNVNPREAAFAAPGSIAIQSLRRGRIEVGETVAVIGLGMVGQLTVQVAKAASARVVAVDTNESRRTLAARLGADIVSPTTDYQSPGTKFFQGVDAAIITTDCPDSSAPLVQALEMVRHRGRVVMVGDVRCEFPRDLWDEKDAELLIATACGPGRGDSQYEEHGHDYPIGYVRWTEGRNLQEFVRLLGAGLVKVAPLITHEFPFERAPEAYELVLAKPDECLGVVLKYA